MSTFPQKPWSDNPNAPKISPREYSNEKANFIGIVASSILYGILVILFFRCMNALLDPVNRARGGIRWLLVTHTVVMFSIATIFIAMHFNLQSFAYVDNREFHGTEEIPPGPLEYQLFTASKGIGPARTVMVFLNNWLADGLLLYRCCVIFVMNYWAIALPFLIYLASLAMGIVSIYHFARPITTPSNAAATIIKLTTPYYLICPILNVLLTLMIVARLTLHSRRVRNAMGSSAEPNKLYKVVITMLIESSSLYSITFLLLIGPWVTHSPAEYFFLSVLAQTQVIAPFLIILRVANRRAWTRDTVSGNASSLHFGSQRRSMGCDGSTPDGCPSSSTDSRRRARGEHKDGVVTTVDLQS